MNNSAINTTIDLLRHGEPVGGSKYRGHLDDPLSEKGWRQMRLAVGDKCPWERIISSPLSRCADFSRELANRYQRPLVFDDRFKEIGFGAWEGRTATEIIAEDPDSLMRFWADPANNTPPNAEPLHLFSARVIEAWQHLLQDNRGKHILLVAHAGTIRQLICHVLDMPLERLFRFAVPNAGLSRIRIEYSAGGYVLPQLIFHAGVLPVE